MLEANGGIELTEKRNPQKSNPEGLEVGDLVFSKWSAGQIGIVVALDVTPSNVYEKETTDAIIYWSGGDTHEKGRVDALHLEKISL